MNEPMWIDHYPDPRVKRKRSKLRTVFTLALWVLLAILSGGVCALLYAMFNWSE